MPGLGCTILTDQGSGQIPHLKKKGRRNMKKFLAEFIGTAVLVTFACGTAVVTGCNGADPSNGAYALTALAFGLVIVAMAYSIGNVSGCHINPAVSLGVLINGGIGFGEFILYLIAQCAGATCGALLLKYMIGAENGLGANALYQGDIMKSLIIECVLTFVFVLAVLGATSKAANSNVAGLVIGGSLTLVHLLGIALTGTSVNPARSLGPALILGGDALSVVWVFIAGPLAGGAIAGVVWQILKDRD